MKRHGKETKGQEYSIRLIGAGIVLVGFGIDFYLNCPCINPQSEDFWIRVIVLLSLATFLTLPIKRSESGRIYIAERRLPIVGKILSGTVLAAVLAMILGGVFSSPVFFAKKYASFITVETRSFLNDIPDSEHIEDIALMDTESAAIIGERAIGSLSDVVSQYEVSDWYCTFNYAGKPMKVASLEYADIFKWISNRKEGVPGYVLVDPVKNEASFVKLTTSIQYTMSGHFQDNLQRHLRFQYPTAMFEGYYLELNDEGEPFYICPVLEAKVGLFGAKDVKGVVICNPCDGSSTYYDLADVPTWVDRVYDGSLAQKKYDWYGQLSGGYINSKIGNKGCKMTTDDYGYKTIDDDLWIYTGVTSVNGDESNIGFVMMNLRTCESRYYEIAGAEEYSAMASAEGQVQHLGYHAAFPSLINIDGCPTYIMVLKDDGGLVKLYALVNVEKYNIVATGASQKEALTAYRKLLRENGIAVSDVVNEELEKTKDRNN